MNMKNVYGLFAALGFILPTHALAILDAPIRTDYTEDLKALAAEIDGQTVGECSLDAFFDEKNRSVSAQLRNSAGHSVPFILDYPVKNTEKLGAIRTANFEFTNDDHRYKTTLTFIVTGRRDLKRLGITVGYQEIRDIVGISTRRFDKKQRYFGWPDTWKRTSTISETCTENWLPSTQLPHLASALNSIQDGACKFVLKISRHGQRTVAKGVLRDLDGRKEHPVEFALDTGGNKHLTEQEVSLGSDTTQVRYLTEEESREQRHILDVLVDNPTGEIHGLTYSKFKRDEKTTSSHSVGEWEKTPEIEINCIPF